MSRRQLSVLNERLDLSRQFQKPKRVRHMAAAFADDFGKLLLAVIEALDQLAIAAGLFDGIEVRALNVLDDRELEHFLVGELSHDDRNGMHPARCAARQRRSPATIS